MTRIEETRLVALRSYREPHVIEPVTLVLDEGPVTVCGHDGIRIHPTRGDRRRQRGYRHDQSDLDLLAQTEASFA